MTRSELLALADLLAAGTITDSESLRLAAFVTQVADSEPVAWASKNKSSVMNVTQSKGLADSWREQYTVQHGMTFVVPLYTLPLED